MAKDNIILGEGVIYSTDSKTTGLNNNIIVCGCSGCGKTVSIVEARLLEAHDSSLVVPVTKRRIVEKYKKPLQERGYTVNELDFVNPKESPSGYDPLHYVHSYSDITYLAKSIVKANPKKENTTADPYWDDAAISLLSAEIAYTMMADVKGKATFADVLKLHDSMDITGSLSNIETTLDEQFERLEALAPKCFAISCWNSFRKLPEKTARCVFGTLNTTLDTIFTPDLRKMISNSNQVDIRKLGAEKNILFIITSPVNTSLHTYINIIYSQIFKELFEYSDSLPDGKLQVPVNMVCDDFATGSRILDFPEYISVFREKEISVTLLIQSESQLESMYGYGDATTIINNCDTYIYMGGMDIKTGKSMSERLNVPLDEVLYMPIGQEFIFRRGQKPITTTRYKIMEDDRYKEITDEK